LLFANAFDKIDLGRSAQKSKKDFLANDADALGS
jgi:hypothetical protein